MILNEKFSTPISILLTYRNDGFEFLLFHSTNLNYGSYAKYGGNKPLSMTSSPMQDAIILSTFESGSVKI